MANLTVSELHTPKINRIAVYDGAVFNDIHDFLEENSTGLSTKFVPNGLYTVSHPVNSAVNGQYTLLGAGGNIVRWGRGGVYYAQNGVDNVLEAGCTLFVCTSSAGFIGFAAPDVPHTTNVTFKDFHVSQRVSSVSAGQAIFDLTDAKYVNIENIGIDEYGLGDSVKSLGMAINATGTCEFVLRNATIVGFGGNTYDSNLNTSASCYFETCSLISLENLTFAGDNCSLQGFLTFKNCYDVHIRNIGFNDWGHADSYSYAIKVTGSSALTTSIEIDGMIVSDFLCTSTQRGMFNIQSPYCNILIDGLRFEDDATNSVPDSIAPIMSPGRVTVRGHVGCSAVNSQQINTGFITNFIENPYNIITPCPRSAISSVTASINYTVSVRPAYIEVKGGTGVVPTVSGRAVAYDVAGTNYYVNVGDTINLGAFTVSPTLSVFFVK